MDTNGLARQATLQLSIGHLLVIWDILSNRLSETPYKNEFTEEEKRAIWALEDLCEDELVQNGFGARPKHEWDAQMKQATEFVKSIPVEFVD